MKTLSMMIGTSLFTVLFMAGFYSLAQDGTTPLIIPYHGHIYKDGTAMSGPVELHFSLYDKAEGEDPPVWQETVTVNVSNGEFMALLGADKNNPITDAVDWARDVYLGVSVVAEGGEEVNLSNRQRFLPVPYAGGIAPAANIVVGEDLQINGSDMRLGYSDGLASCKQDGTGQACRAMVHDQTGDNKARLVINYNNDFEAGTKIDSDLEVSGGLSVGQRPIKFARYDISPKQDDVTTDFSTSEWFCAIGGVTSTAAISMREARRTGTCSR
ncbi:MAG: hypothetical protein GXP49_14215 [Deltaproteobacteria bacterium]|nr:hypothetical protein [Deltaproteobacteria bacterium]